MSGGLVRVSASVRASQLRQQPQQLVPLISIERCEETVIELSGESPDVHQGCATGVRDPYGVPASIGAVPGAPHESFALERVDDGDHLAAIDAGEVAQRLLRLPIALLEGEQDTVMGGMETPLPQRLGKLASTAATKVREQEPRVVEEQRHRIVVARGPVGHGSILYRWDCQRSYESTQMSTLPKAPPRWLVRLNIAFLRLGLRVGTQHVLTVRGRITGKPRSTPVSIVTVEGGRFIVAALADVDWVKNARVAGGGLLARGRRDEAVSLVELPVEERGPILREFLRQVPGGVRFFGVSPDPDVLTASAAKYPVFSVEPLSAG